MPDSASAQTPQFVTWEFLGTYASASFVVAVVTNTIRRVTGISAPWTAFVSSVVVSAALSWHLGTLKDLAGAALAFFNACMLFCSALGMQETALDVEAKAKRVPGQFKEHARRQIKWLSPWFSRD